MKLVVKVVGVGVLSAVVKAGVEGGVVGEDPRLLVSVLSPAVSSAATEEMVDMTESGNFGTLTARVGSSQQEPSSADA